MPVSEPSKYTTLWAQSGIRFDIPPAADPMTGKAGFDVGFSSINMASEAAGGIPPWGQDFNGIFYSLTKAAQYTQAGGVPTFDAALAAAVGGYGKGAVVIGDDGSTLWQNEVSGNTSNPNVGGANWINLLLKTLPKRTFANNDYIRIPDTPGGLIIQWGYVDASSTSGSATVTLPIEFPSAAIACVMTRNGSVWENETYWNVEILSRSQIACRLPPSSAAFATGYYIAIGF